MIDPRLSVYELLYGRKSDGRRTDITKRGEASSQPRQKAPGVDAERAARVAGHYAPRDVNVGVDEAWHDRASARVNYRGAGGYLRLSTPDARYPPVQHDDVAVRNGFCARPIDNSAVENYQRLSVAKQRHRRHR